MPGGAGPGMKLRGMLFSVFCLGVVFTLAACAPSGRQELSFADLEGRPCSPLLLSGSKETLRREANLIHLPHQSGHHHPDLVHASDAIVGKAGYGTVAEVMAAGIPFARILRENFRESQVLGSYLDKEGEGFAMSPSEFASASWLNRLEELLAYPRKKNRQLDGAAQAAEHIAPYL